MNDQVRPREYVHVVPVGTSLLTNTGWKPGRRLPAKTKLVKQLRDQGPRVLSAELNALLPFIDRFECTRVHLVATETPEGRLCRDALASYLQSRSIQITAADAPDLLPASPNHGVGQVSFNQGIRQFREKVFRAVRQATRKGAVVMLNATGGLKAEVAVAVLIAAELRISAYYLHQSMTAPIFLPTVAVDPGLRASLAKLADRKSVAHRSVPLDAQELSRLEYEGLVKISHRPDGAPSNVRLTRYGQYWAKAT